MQLLDKIADFIIGLDSYPKEMDRVHGIVGAIFGALIAVGAGTLFGGTPLGYVVLALVGGWAGHGLVRICQEAIGWMEETSRWGE